MDIPRSPGLSFSTTWTGTTYCDSTNPSSRHGAQGENCDRHTPTAFCSASLMRFLSWPKRTAATKASPAELNEEKNDHISPRVESGQSPTNGSDGSVDASIERQEQQVVVRSRMVFQSCCVFPPIHKLTKYSKRFCIRVPESRDLQRQRRGLHHLSAIWLSSDQDSA